MKDDARMNDQDERLEWMAPAITEWDVVAETQLGGTSLNFDGTGTYS